MAIECGIEKEAWPNFGGQNLISGSATWNGLRYDEDKNAVWTHPQEGGGIQGMEGAATSEVTGAAYVNPNDNGYWGTMTTPCWISNVGTRGLWVIPWMSAKIHAEIMFSTYQSVGARVWLNSVPTQDVTLPGGTYFPPAGWGQSPASYTLSVAGSTVKIGGAIHWMGLPVLVPVGGSHAIQVQPIQLLHVGNWDTTVARYRWCDYLRCGWIGIRQGVMA